MSEVRIKNFKRVLVANRGEIAIRVFRALNGLGITSVAVYSKEDKYAMFRTLADEAYPLNPEKGPIDAYLDIPTILKIAKDHNVDAIHPGYGFLAENPVLVEECEKNGITFIGPTVDSMNAMVDAAEREASAELLLDSKGFLDAVVSISDGTADVVINQAEISEAERAQIEDIVKRKTNISGENIIITPRLS